MRLFSNAVAAILLLLVSSCAANKSPSVQIPDEVALNKDAGRGNLWLLPLKLESSQELRFFVDTGSPVTFFDESIAPKLGRRLGTAELQNFGTRSKSGLYKVPRLYLGNTPLKISGNFVCTWDLATLSREAGCPIAGILGMDCLRNYCIQLDFEGGQVHFLDPGRLDSPALGTVFPLKFSSENESSIKLIRPVIRGPSPFGGSADCVLVDTGYRADGALEAGTFRRVIVDSDGLTVPADHGRFWVSRRTWNGGTYTNLLLGDGADVIGLQFLARHLVTLNFPKRMMYLKQTSAGPLVNEDIKEAETFFNSLKENGKLPGWSKDDEGLMCREAFPQFQQFDGRKTGDLSDRRSSFHYRVARTSEGSGWELQKAWRTDKEGKAVEEYSVH